MTDILQLIADDQNRVNYHPAWNDFTGGVTSTILLKQVIYWWVKQKRRPFYKFNEPCNHRSYRAGDSWCEELGLSRKELETARRRIGIRTKGEVNNKALISYWTDSSRKTWYALNETSLLEHLSEIYPDDADGSVGIQKELMPESDISNAELMPESDIRDAELMPESDITLMPESDIRDAELMPESDITLMPESDISLKRHSTTNNHQTTSKPPPLPPGELDGGGSGDIQEILVNAGIWPDVAKMLAGLPHVTLSFVEAHIATVPTDENDRVKPNLLRWRIENNVSPPEPKPHQGLADYEQYVPPELEDVIKR